MKTSALRRTRRAWLLMLCCLAGAGYCQEGYPSRPVRIIVAYPAGGAVDPPARILAQQLSVQTGQQFVVENRPGAGGNLGTDAAVKSAPDGYTLLFTGPNITIAPTLMKATTHFDPVTSFTPVAQVVTVPTVVAVNADSKLRSIADLIAEDKQRPGQLTYASPGSGSPSQLAMELFKARSGARIRHIPYKGSAPAITDLLGRQVDMLVSTLASPIEHIRAGKLRGLGVTSATRAAELPDVPPIGDTVPGFELVTWLGVAGPQGLSRSVVERLNVELAKAIADPATARKLREAGTTPDYQPAEVLAKRIQAEAALYSRLITEAKLTPD